VTDQVAMCSICELSVRRCLGHRGLRAHIANDRRVMVVAEEYEAAEREYHATYDRWQKREGAANRRGGKGSGA
jgi:hypothetical protein